MELRQIAQRVTDLDRASDFYTVLLERAPSARFADPDLLFFDLDGVRLLLDVNAPSALHYFEVDNVHETIERLGGAVEVVTQPHVIFVHDTHAIGPEGQEEWQAFVRDTEGNTIGLIAFQKP